MKHLLIFSLCLFCISSNAQQKAYSSTIPHKKNYNPKTLDECIQYWDIHFPDSTKKHIAAMSENKFVAEQHFNLGMWMRNNWGLWGGIMQSRKLAKHFNEMGIFHPDDMSGIILTSYHRHLNNKPIELEKQVKYYQDYWSKASSVGLKPDTIKAPEPVRK